MTTILHPLGAGEMARIGPAASDFHIGIHLDALIGDAQALGFGFGYQAHFRPFTPSINRQRRSAAT